MSDITVSILLRAARFGAALLGGIAGAGAMLACMLAGLSALHAGLLVAACLGAALAWHRTEESGF